jgi:tetratricopeptide (TPR) repeat protein
MNCTQCGTEYLEMDKFCPQCGAKLDTISQSLYSTQVGLNIEDVRNNLGTVYYKMGKFDQALNEFKAVLKNNPNDQKAQEMLELLQKEHSIF